MQSVGGAAYRLATDAVSLAHLAYRSVRRQPSWTWADVEADRGSPLLRIYGSVFPVLLSLARIGAMPRGMHGATLLVKARALPPTRLRALTHYDEQRRVLEHSGLTRTSGEGIHVAWPRIARSWYRTGPRIARRSELPVGGPLGSHSAAERYERRVEREAPDPRI